MSPLRIRSRRSNQLLCCVLLAATACAPSDGRPILTDDEIGSARSVGSVPLGGDQFDDRTSTTTGAQAKPITLGFAGDTHFVGGLDRNDPLGAVAELMSAPDLMAVNLETTVAEPDIGVAPVEKEFLFRSPPESAQLLEGAGVDVAALGNNHVWDFGDAATLRTIELVESAGVMTVGAGIDRDDAFRPLVAAVGDWTVGIISASQVPCDWADRAPEQRTVVSWACDPFLDRIDAAIAELEVTADVTVVMVHWGLTTEPCPDGSIRELAQRWADEGVDLIVGSHPHVLRGLDRIGDTWLLHSTGNYLFSSPGNRAHTALFTALVSEGADGEAEIAIHAEPLQIRDGRPGPVEEGTRLERLAELTDRSFGFRFADDGWAVADPTQVSICATSGDQSG